MKIDGGPQKGQWGWSFLPGHSEFRLAELSSVEADKQDAADKIRAAFARYLEYPADKGGGAGSTPDKWRQVSNAYTKAKGR
jgi:hypothetical protein